MLYAEIENLLIEEYENCYLNKWVIDCGRNVITKIIAFNLFCEIHFENIKKIDLKEIIKIIEVRVKEIVDSDPELDIIDKSKYIFNTDFPYLWKTCKTELDYVNKISTVIVLDIFKTEIILSWEAKSLKRNFYQLLNRESIEEIITDFKEYQKKSGSRIGFYGENKARWFVLSSDLDNIIMENEENDELATQIRNLLGLLTEEKYLVEIQYKPDTANPGHVPTLFHTSPNYNHVFFPRNNVDGWGITLNLKNLKAGCKESIQKRLSLPEFNHRSLGKCLLKPKIKSREWEEYLEHRIEDFKNWANESDEILLDLKYFLSKWRK